VPALLHHYLIVTARELGVEPKQLSSAAQDKLVAYAWPGNVRELVNLCRRLTVLAPGSEIQPDDLPLEIAATGSADQSADWTVALAAWAERQTAGSSRPLLDDAQPEFERVLIRAALRRTQGHRQDAAKLLGWGRNTLTRKLKELGMNGDEIRG
jgi:two-component system nitrogen regulation response regulator GlnG